MNKGLVFTLLALIIAIYPYSARAVEQLNFSDKISPSLKYQVNIFLEKTYKTDISLYNIAEIDLNNDGIDEHILKRKACNTKENQCIYSVIAEKGDEIILLAKIRARNIIAGETSSYGIKDILAFKNEINDYNFDIYMWSPSQKMYIINTE